MISCKILCPQFFCKYAKRYKKCNENKKIVKM